MLRSRSQSCQNFHVKILCNSFYDLITSKPSDVFDLHWYHDIYWSKVFISTISTHDHDPEVKVTDLEFKSFSLNF